MDRKDYNSKPHIINGVLLKFPRAMAAVAKASEVGCIKYDTDIANDWNYQGASHKNYLDPIGRHLIAHSLNSVNIETGGKLPPEGMQVLHLAQAAWSCLAALENFIKEQEEESITQYDHL